MSGFVYDIKEKAKMNTNFREVVETGKDTQIVIMSLLPNEDIGEEVHPKNDQVLYLVEGEGKAVLDDEAMLFREGDMVLVKAGTKHNFINTGEKDMKIITLYSPPAHMKGTIHKTKQDAQKEETGYAHTSYL